MRQLVWTLANLTPEQEQALKDAEATLGAGALLAFRRAPVTLSDLTPSQVECLEGLEQKLGLALVAVEPK
jgi:hypothetical protein